MTTPVCSTTCGSVSPGAAAATYSASKMHNEAAFPVPFGAPVIVNFDTIDFDVGSSVTPSLAANTLTINEDGFYEVIFCDSWNSPTTPVGTVAFLFLNNVAILSSSLDTAHQARASCTPVLLELRAGDVLEVRVAINADLPDVIVFASLSAEKRG